MNFDGGMENLRITCGGGMRNCGISSAGGMENRGIISGGMIQDQLRSRTVDFSGLGRFSIRPPDLLPRLGARVVCSHLSQALLDVSLKSTPTSVMTSITGHGSTLHCTAFHYATAYCTL